MMECSRFHAKHGVSGLFDRNFIQKNVRNLRRWVAVALCGVVALTAGAAQRWLGGDVSMLTANERAGIVYRDITGRQVEPMKFFKQLGWNMMRVRLFVDPANAPGDHHDEGVCQDLPYVRDLCVALKRAGYKVMLDFHYSDTWADPGKQYTPRRWEGLDAHALADSIEAYTDFCLRVLNKAGATPDMIQVGNEITNGMDWPVGRIDPSRDDNWDTLIMLLKAGVRACRKQCPRARLIIHTEKAGDWDITRSYYDHLRSAGLDYDIIGLSYYPMWHRDIATLGRTLDSLAVRFPDKEVMIVETAYFYEHDGRPAGDSEDFSHCPPGTVQGQLQFTTQLIAELKRHSNVTGLFWWYPEENYNGIAKPRFGGLNRGLFNSKTGVALPALYQLRTYLQ